MAQSIAIYSKGIRRIPHLDVFLGDEQGPAEIRFGRTEGAEAVAGWGRKDTAAKARSEAAAAGLPYLALEDGFFRSLDLGVNGAAPLSLIVDRSGIYYDAENPSDLETMLEQGGWESDELLARARQGIARVRAERLSKYNAFPDLAPGRLPDDGRAKILVVDQTFDDASIRFGAADAASFTVMLDTALDDNPDATIVIKTHPDVASGKKRGYLDAVRLRGRCLVIAEAVNPWSLLERVDKVYTVTSQLGFEALLAQKPVHCFGLPFYAGWGASADAKNCPRRTQPRSIEEIFAAACLLYPRYLDPFREELCSFERALDILATSKRHNDGNRRRAHCLGMSWWKKDTVGAFLDSTDGRARFHRDPARAIAAAKQDGGRVVVWASRESQQLEALCERAGVPLERMEDGFLRSAGLGAAFLPAASAVIDRRGVYYDPSRESDLEHVLERGTISHHQAARAAALRAEIVRRGLTKYNVGAKPEDMDLPADRSIVLVPGQVEDDASIVLGAGAIRTNIALLQAVRQARPDAFIVYKPHPDVEAGLRRGYVGEAAALKYADRVVSQVSSDVLIALADEVHTMTSLVGFEALLREKRVATYGLPFYAGWGLSDDQVTCPRRTRQRSLDELVWATLLDYPLYVDPFTGLACDIDVILERLSAPRQAYGRLAGPLKSAVTAIRRLIGYGLQRVR